MGFGIERGIRNIFNMPSRTIGAENLAKISEIRISNYVDEYNHFAKIIEKQYPKIKASEIKLVKSDYNNDMSSYENDNKSHKKLAKLQELQESKHIKDKKMLKILLEAQLILGSVMSLKSKKIYFQTAPKNTLLERDYLDNDSNFIRSELDHLRHLLGHKTIKPLYDPKHETLEDDTGYFRRFE